MRRHFFVGCAIVFILILAVFLYRNRQASWFLQGAAPHNDKIKGPRNAPITIDEFSDFQCPSCARSQEPLKKLLAQFPNLIRVHFYHFPLAMHPMALEASKWAECAAEQRKFWSFGELLFQEQNTWSKDPDPKVLFLSYVNSISANRDQFLKCLKAPQALARVEADKQAGGRFQISSTPTFFINGERLVGSKQLEDKGSSLVQKKLAGLIKQKEKT